MNRFSSESRRVVVVGIVMAEAPKKSFQELAERVGDYPEQAYHFVREGLSFAVTQTHGPETPAQAAIRHYQDKHEIDFAELCELYEGGGLPDSVVAAIEDAGGIEKLNRHVGGGELCWGLREYAHYRWGALARLVLDSWNIHCTRDFGRLVFAMIDYELMQKQPSDSLDDFNDVFDFHEAFDGSYKIRFGCK